MFITENINYVVYYVYYAEVGENYYREILELEQKREAFTGFQLNKEFMLIIDV